MRSQDTGRKILDVFEQSLHAAKINGVGHNGSVTKDSDPDWHAQFVERVPTFERLRSEVDHILEAVLTDIKIHDIRVRVKKMKSFLEKIERKEYSDPFVEMTDIVGARVVCLFVDDIREVERVIEREFVTIEKQNKSDESKPEIFGYQSIHFLCRLKSGYRGPRYDGLHNLVFEVQLRSILQDAWAVVEHTLAYKGKVSTPPDLRRDFSALAGLLHVADKTFQQIRDRGEILESEANREIRKFVTSSDAEGIGEAEDISIDRNTLKAFLAEKFPDREGVADSLYSYLVEDLAEEGITRMSQVRDMIENHLDAVLERERLRPPRNPDTREAGRFSRLAILRMMFFEEFPGRARHRIRSRPGPRARMKKSGDGE